MIKVEAIENFTLEKFNEIKNIQRMSKDQKGKLYKGDVFECTEEMAKYLTGENALQKTVVKIIEVKPEKEEVKKTVENTTEEIKPKTTTKKRSTKKTTKKAKE